MKIIILIAMGLTAAGAGVICVFRGQFRSLSSNLTCSIELGKRFKSLDISHWIENAANGNGGVRLNGQYGVFSFEIFIALTIAIMIVVNVASWQLFRSSETCIMCWMAVLLFGCAAVETWYASGFGVLDRKVDGSSETAWVDFTIISWALAAAALFVAGFIVITDTCFNCCCAKETYY